MMNFSADETIALGVGLTNACNLSCAHCYRGTGVDQLAVEDVLKVVDAVPVRSINFGTGENGLHPHFATIIEALSRRGIAVTMTTNGFSTQCLTDATLRLMRDVEFSIDYPDEVSHDGARGPGNWALIAKEMARCTALGVSTTLVTVMMSTNHRALPMLARLAGERSALLRVNVYQAVHTDQFSLSFDQFWDGWRALLECADLIACGEPILRAMLGLPHVAGSGCGGETVRLTPKGAVVPCVYGDEDSLHLDD
ncbi:MAG: hypothetical protein NVS3B20_07710 [Polyangiales bacterium]